MNGASDLTGTDRPGAEPQREANEENARATIQPARDAAAAQISSARNTSDDPFAGFSLEDPEDLDREFPGAGGGFVLVPPGGFSSAAGANGPVMSQGPLFDPTVAAGMSNAGLGGNLFGNVPAANGLTAGPNGGK